MISKALRKWVAKAGSQIQYIAQGSPWENGYCESLNGKLRDERLRQKIFYLLKEAQIVIGPWQNTHNRVRPPSSLDYRPPAPASFPDLAFRLPGAATMQEPLNQPGSKYRSGQLRPDRRRRACVRHVANPLHHRWHLPDRLGGSLAVGRCRLAA